MQIEHFCVGSDRTDTDHLMRSYDRIAAKCMYKINLIILRKKKKKNTK